MHNGSTAAQIVGGAPGWRGYQNAIALHGCEKFSVDIDIKGANPSCFPTRHLNFIESLQCELVSQVILSISNLSNDSHPFV